MRTALPVLFTFCCLAIPPVHAQTDAADEEVARLKARIALLEERLARIESRMSPVALKPIHGGSRSSG